MFFGKIKEIGKIVREIEISKIRVPSCRFRRSNDENLELLTASIREHGILEPILVRRDGENYILAAGERRLMAAKALGKESVPCITVDDSDVDSAVVSIIENIHRENLNMFEEASAILSLISLSGMTQEQCARRLAVSQSYIANKIRLLKLLPEEREAILEKGLTERHGRAILRLEPGKDRMEVIRIMAERHMNVSSAEEYVELLLCAQAKANRTSPDQRERIVTRDLRNLCISIDQAVDIVRRTGIQVESSKRETERGTLISILLPKQAG